MFTPKQSDFTFSRPLTIREWAGGKGKVYVQIGFVREHPEHNQICLYKQYPGKDGVTESYKYWIKGSSDWLAIRKAVESLWPDLERSDKLSSNGIDQAVQRVSQEVELLDLLIQYPNLLANLPNDIDLFTMPETQKAALKRLLSAGGDVAAKAIEKLADEPVSDIADLVKVLDGLRLASVNSLVNHIKARVGFIEQFEKAIHDEDSYERRGLGSIHNLLKANIWILDRNYTILNDDTTLKNIILQNFPDDAVDFEGSSRRPDFLCMTNSHSVTETPKQLVIIEIKRPSVVLKMAHIEQLMDYRNKLNRYSGSSIVDFKCYLIGREVNELLRENSLTASGFLVKTYTDFISEARHFYTDYAAIIEAEKYAI